MPHLKIKDEEVEFSVDCGDCGNDLANEVDVIYEKGSPSINVNLCPVCQRKRDREQAALELDVRDLTASLEKLQYKYDLITVLRGEL